MSDNYSVTVRIAGTNQLSMPAGQAQQSLRGLNQEAQRTNQTLSQLKSVGMGLFAGVTLAGAFRMAEDMYQAGVAAQRAEMLYRSFGAQVGDTDALLERLRRTTRGVVDDVELMNAANSMLSMGLAKNASDVERLMDIGVTFAQAMGQDVGASLENLNMILANQSYLRLDSLGISSSQVRELAQQYQRAGMDSSEAFTAAFLDVAEGKLPQMSMVADATVTEFEKLSVAAGNWWTDVQERFATGVNVMVDVAKNGGILIRAALFGEGSAQAGNTAAADPMIQTVAGSMANIWFDQLGGAGLGADNPMRVNDVGQRSGWIASLMAASQMQDRPISSFSAQDVAMLTGNAANSLIAEQIKEWASAGMERLNAATLWAAESQEALAVETEQLTATTATANATVATDPMTAQRGGMMNESNIWLQAIRAQMGRNVSPFMTGSDAYSVGQAAAEVQRVVDEMMRLNEVNPGFLSEQNVEMLSQMAAEAGSAADQAERMARALENASLSQLFGQTGGGRLGEIDSAILGQMQAEGASDATIEAMRTALGLNSGQLTQMSVQFEQEVIPQLSAIASQYGADAVIAARTAYEAAVQQAALSGQTGPLNLPSILGYEEWNLGGTGAGSYTVQAGDSLWGIANANGLTVDQLRSMNALSGNLITPGQSLSLGGAGGSMVMPAGFDMLEWQTAGIGLETSVSNAAEEATTITDEMQTAADTLATGIEGVFSKTYQLPIELVISGGGILGQLIAAAVAGNGGTVPGSSPNAGRSSSGRGTSAPIVSGGRAMTP